MELRTFVNHGILEVANQRSTSLQAILLKWCMIGLKDLAGSEQMRSVQEGFIFQWIMVTDENASLIENFKSPIKFLSTNLVCHKGKFCCKEPCTQFVEVRDKFSISGYVGPAPPSYNQIGLFQIQVLHFLFNGQTDRVDVIQKFN